MLKIIPLLVTAVLALPGPLLAQDTGVRVADYRGARSDCADSGQDEAHHCNRVARSPRTFLISWWEIPSIGT